MLDTSKPTSLSNEGDKYPIVGMLQTEYIK